MADKEYIERAALEKEIDEAQNELTSNDDRIWYINKPYFKGLAWARRLLLDAPAADVVEVVRCKDCKYYRDWGDCTTCSLWTLDWDVGTDPNAFCSYGERKE